MCCFVERAKAIIKCSLAFRIPILSNAYQNTMSKGIQNKIFETTKRKKRHIASLIGDICEMVHSPSTSALLYLKQFGFIIIIVNYSLIVYK